MSASHRIGSLRDEDVAVRMLDAWDEAKNAVGRLNEFFSEETVFSLGVRLASGPVEMVGADFRRKRA